MENSDSFQTPNTTPSTQEVPQQVPLPIQTVKRSNVLKTSFIVIALILFGILIGILVTRFIPAFYTSRLTDIPTVAITPMGIETPTPTLNVTADWKTYTSTKYNFSIKYPGSWENVVDTKSAPVSINKIVEGLTFEAIFLDKSRELMCGPYTCYPSVQIITPIKDSSTAKLVLKDWVINYIKSKSSDIKIDPSSSVEEIQIDNHQAIWYGNTVFIANNGFVHLISFDSSGSSAGKESAKDNIQNIFDQILSTFKFADISLSPQPSNKTQLREAIQGYSESIINNDRNKAMSFLTVSAQKQVENIDWPGNVYTQYKSFEVLNEYHSAKEEEDFYNTEPVKFDIKFYLENDPNGKLTSISFVREGNKWKTSTWNIFTGN